MNILDMVFEKAGGRAKLAEALNISRQTTYQWKRVPFEHIKKIEELTGMSRHELRPDLSEFFRETAA